MKRSRRRAATAILTIASPGTMTKEGRDTIAAWLKNTALKLQREGDEYTDGRFVA